MKNVQLLIATIAGTLLLVVGVAVLFSSKAQDQQSQQLQASQPVDEAVLLSRPSNVLGVAFEQEPVEVRDPELSNDPTPTADPTASAAAQTDQQAVVTIVEFSDFQCPACKQTSPLLKQVLAAYPENTRLVYRHMPLVSIHPFAQLAAQASEAAADEGKFWEYHDLLFDRQQEWSRLDSLEKAGDIFVTYAEELGIDSGSFRAKMGSEEIKQRVTTDLAEGVQLGVNATPTLFVDNTPVSAQNLVQTVETRLTSR